MAIQWIDLEMLRKRVEFQKSICFGDVFEPFSFEWIDTLYRWLVQAKDSEKERREVFESSAEMLLSSDTSPERVRYELSCIPVEIEIAHIANNRLQLWFYGEKRDFYNFDIPGFIQDAFPADYTLDTLEVDKAYWFHFTEDAVREMGLDILELDGEILNRLEVPRWAEDKSLVDMVLCAADSALSRAISLFPDETSPPEVDASCAQEEVSEKFDNHELRKKIMRMLRKGMSLQAIADKLGIKKSRVQYLKNQKPSKLRDHPKNKKK